MAWLAVRYRSPVSTTFERSTYFGNALPGIVVALALVTVSIRYVQPVYQTTLLLLAAYAIMFLPRAVVSVRAAFTQAPPLLDDVAHSLGSYPLGRCAGSRCRSSRPVWERGRHWCSWRS